LRAGDGVDGIGDGEEDEIVVGDVGTREDVRFMLSRASASSSRASTGDPGRVVSGVPVFVIVAVLVSAGKHASTSKRTIIFISTISCSRPKRTL